MAPEPGEGPGRPLEVASIYVHAPFCARRCPYCDYAVEVDRRGNVTPWLDALAGELRALEKRGKARPAGMLDTLYVGGGTPSLLGGEAMDGLAALLGPSRLRGAELEWTVEANPEDVTPELVAAWRRAGVNRLILGLQSLHGPSLRWLGRLHRPETAIAAYETVRAGGFENVGIDLLFGLPGQLGRDWAEELGRILELAPAHVSLYGLTVESGTALARSVAEGRASVADGERRAEEYLHATDILRAGGYEHYEVSSFARPGARSRHNAVYWEGRPYLGLGPGAHSYHPPVRRWNLRDWSEYTQRCGAGRLPEESREEPNAEQVRLERVWLSLRTLEGWPRDAETEGRVGRLLDSWVDQGLARASQNRVHLLPRGWLRLNALAIALDDALAP